jgi:hypothetical protein
MAEEITNNQAPLTARQVAAQNPELDKLRQISFGENYSKLFSLSTVASVFFFFKTISVFYIFNILSKNSTAH